MWDIDNYQRKIFKYLKNCKFKMCSHKKLKEMLGIKDLSADELKLYIETCNYYDLLFEFINDDKVIIYDLRREEDCLYMRDNDNIGYIYVFMNDDKEIIYIGKTINEPNKRFNSHRSKYIQYDEISDIHIYYCADLLGEIEEWLITNHKPKYNQLLLNRKIDVNKDFEVEVLSDERVVEILREVHNKRFNNLKKIKLS